MLEVGDLQLERNFDSDTNEPIGLRIVAKAPELPEGHALIALNETHTQTLKEWLVSELDKKFLEAGGWLSVMKSLPRMSQEVEVLYTMPAWYITASDLGKHLEGRPVLIPEFSPRNQYRTEETVYGGIKNSPYPQLKWNGMRQDLIHLVTHWRPAQ